MHKFIYNNPEKFKEILLLFGFKEFINNSKSFLQTSKEFKIQESQFYYPMKRIISIDRDLIPFYLLETYDYIQSFISKYDRLIKKGNNPKLNKYNYD